MWSRPTEIPNADADVHRPRRGYPKKGGPFTNGLAHRFAASQTCSLKPSELGGPALVSGETMPIGASRRLCGPASVSIPKEWLRVRQFGQPHQVLHTPRPTKTTVADVTLSPAAGKKASQLDQLVLHVIPVQLVIVCWPSKIVHDPAAQLAESTGDEDAPPFKPLVNAFDLPKAAGLRHDYRGPTIKILGTTNSRFGSLLGYGDLVMQVIGQTLVSSARLPTIPFYPSSLTGLRTSSTSAPAWRERHARRRRVWWCQRSR